MAASSSAINSTDWIIQITEDSGSTYDTVASCTSLEINWSMDTRDATTKQSAGRAEHLPGKSSWTASFENLVQFDTEADYDKPNDVFTLADAKTAIGIRVGKINTGDYVYTGNGYFTSFAYNSGVEDNVTNPVGFQGTGQLTQAAYS